MASTAECAWLGCHQVSLDIPEKYINRAATQGPSNCCSANQHFACSSPCRAQRMHRMQASQQARQWAGYRSLHVQLNVTTQHHSLSESLRPISKCIAAGRGLQDQGLEARQCSKAMLISTHQPLCCACNHTLLSHTHARTHNVRTHAHMSQHNTTSA